MSVSTVQEPGLAGLFVFCGCAGEAAARARGANTVATAALAAGRATRAAGRITSRACEVRIAHIAAP